ncbi:hypothetical protein Tco_1484139 [Tanacetum coccineum]
MNVCLAQAIDNDIVKTVVNLSVNEGCETVNECQRCLELKTELLNKKDFVDKETYDKLVRLSTSAIVGSQPSGNTRNDRDSQTQNDPQVTLNGNQLSHQNRIMEQSFVNQTIMVEYYEEYRGHLPHKTSVACSLQQKGFCLKRTKSTN